MNNISLIIFLFVLQIHSFPQVKNKSASIKWYDIEEIVLLNIESPRKIFVYVYSDNCGWCTRMEKNTFSNPVISEYINENYYPVKLNSGIRKDITLGERTYKFIPPNVSEHTPAYHELVATLLKGRLAYPAMAFINEKMAYLGVEMGYKDPVNMEKWLHFIAEDAFLKYANFEEFATEFKGKLSIQE